MSEETPPKMDRSDGGAVADLADHEIDELLILAQLMAHHPPEGWTRVVRRRHLFGLTSTIYRATDDGRTVWAFDGANGPGQVLAIVFRRLFGYRLGTLANQPRPTIVIGMSAGGGKASWIGYRLGVPSVTFSAGRTRAGLRNDGRQQTNISVRGDPFGDPWNGLYGMPLPGRYVLLDRPKGFASHSMAAVLEALRRERHHREHE